MGVKANAVGAGLGAALFFGLAKLSDRVTNKTAAMVAAGGFFTGGAVAYIAWKDRSFTRIPGGGAGSSDPAGLACAKQKIEFSPIKIKISIVGETAAEIDAALSLTIYEVKLLVEELKGVSVARQRIIYMGAIPNNDVELSALGRGQIAFAAGSTLQFAIRPEES